MRPRILLCLAILFAMNGPAQAWNASGHRLSALVAWQEMRPATRAFVTRHLADHPDHARWLEKSRHSPAQDSFAEAATWADHIRNDPRFHDETKEPPGPPIPGLPDQARHKRWHYVDLDAQGKVRNGELDRQIGNLSTLLRSTAEPAEIAWALPWLIHLVGDIHQPLHVGRQGDQGGNGVEIEKSYDKRQPFGNLHEYWDKLPGPASLRGKRLEQAARQLRSQYPPPRQGTVRDWRDESHALLDRAYPTTRGSLLPLIDEAFHRQAHALAEQRLADVGRRLAKLLDDIVEQRVSRETGRGRP